MGWGRGQQDPTPIKSSKRAEKRRAALLNCLTSKKNRESENHEHFPLLLSSNVGQLSAALLLSIYENLFAFGATL